MCSSTTATATRPAGLWPRSYCWHTVASARRTPGATAAAWRAITVCTPRRGRQQTGRSPSQTGCGNSAPRPGGLSNRSHPRLCRLGCRQHPHTAKQPMLYQIQRHRRQLRLQAPADRQQAPADRTRAQTSVDCRVEEKKEFSRLRNGRKHEPTGLFHWLFRD